MRWFNKIQNRDNEPMLCAICNYTNREYNMFKNHMINQHHHTTDSQYLYAFRHYASKRNKKKKSTYNRILKKLVQNSQYISVEEWEIIKQPLSDEIKGTVKLRRTVKGKFGMPGDALIDLTGESNDELNDTEMKQIQETQQQYVQVKKEAQANLGLSIYMFANLVGELCYIYVRENIMGCRQ